MSLAMSQKLGRIFAVRTAMSTSFGKHHAHQIAAASCSEKRRSVDVPYARCHNFQQMTVWITEVERLASIFPCLTQLNRDALILQPAFPSRQITTSDPERDVNCADCVRISGSAFFEQQQHAAITRTHRAKARLIVNASLRAPILLTSVHEKM